MGGVQVDGVRYLIAHINGRRGGGAAPVEEVAAAVGLSIGLGAVVVVACYQRAAPAVVDGVGIAVGDEVGRFDT